MKLQGARVRRGQQIAADQPLLRLGNYGQEAERRRGRIAGVDHGANGEDGKN